MADKLTTREILELKARAHHLNPVVMVGQHGLTESVIKETDAALTAHELIKVRVLGDDRAERIAICEALCEAVDAQLVQHIGKLLVLWRENTEK
ncbi:ribosome assembly RNA-binding protein YhbY [Neisseria dentiae]|uniref:ribosome assembly RNA-binding protein YhbY n=1 Tax=Neisseria dentiae TaxID=194197 RepID=UPI0035A17A0B